jgi:ABC-type branched-subunit amino acid transport system substrate-binding protein
MVLKIRSLVLWPMAVSLMCVALVVGCSSNSASTSAGSTTQNSKGAVKIFVTSSFTGATFSDPEALSGAEAAASTINAAGGINGHPIVIISCDDQLTPSLATQCAQKAVKDGVTAVTGVLLFGQQTFSVLTPAEIPVIDAEPIAPIETSAANSFPINAGAFPTFTGAAEKVVESGARNVAIIQGNNAINQTGTPYIVQGVKAAGGNVVRIVTATAGSPSYAPYVSAALAGGKVQGLLWVGTFADTAKLVLAARQGGFNGPIGMSGSDITSSIVKSLGSAANNLYLASPYFIPPSKVAAPFVASMKKYAPGASIDVVSQEVFAAVQTAAVALRDSSSFTASALTKALSSQTALTAGPYAPVVNMTQPGPIAGSPRLFTTDVEFYKIENGAFTSIGGFFNPYAK